MSSSPVPEPSRSPKPATTTTTTTNVPPQQPLYIPSAVDVEAQSLYDSIPIMEPVVVPFEPAQSSSITASKPPPALPSVAELPSIPTTKIVDQPAAPPPKSKDEFKIFIGGLSWETTEESLRNYLSQFATILDCQVLRDPETKRSRGFGFACLGSAADIEAIMSKPDGHYLDGKAIDPKRTVHKRTPPQNKGEKLFIGGVPSTTNEDNVREFFARFGPIAEVNVVMDRATGKPKGYAFVTYEDFKSVDAAIARQEAQGYTLFLDKRVDVKRAAPRDRQGQVVGQMGPGARGMGLPYPPVPYGAFPPPPYPGAEYAAYGMPPAAPGYDMAAYNNYMAAYYGQYYGQAPPPGQGPPHGASPMYPPAGGSMYPGYLPPSGSPSPIPPAGDRRPGGGGGSGGPDKSNKPSQRGYHPYSR